MIDIDRVCFSYGQKEVFRGLTLHVGAGERVAVCGESGCGKTTLLRLVMGLEKPVSGTVTVRTARIGALFQEDRLLPYLTVARNCELFAADAASVRPMLRALGLSDAADALPSALSGGMARRAALARSLCRSAELYLFDEPFNGLDTENAARAAELVCRVTEGKTVLVVTHRAGEADALRCRTASIEEALRGLPEQTMEEHQRGRTTQ